MKSTKSIRELHDEEQWDAADQKMNEMIREMGALEKYTRRWLPLRERIFLRIWDAIGWVISHVL